MAGIVLPPEKDKISNRENPRLGAGEPACGCSLATRLLCDIGQALYSSDSHLQGEEIGLKGDVYIRHTKMF